jgi:hypothetical protein
VGQAVPFRKTYVPTDAERQTWQMIRESNRQQAANGLTVEQTLALVRSPRWVVRPDFWRTT